MDKPIIAQHRIALSLAGPTLETMAGNGLQIMPDETEVAPARLAKKFSNCKLAAMLQWNPYINCITQQCSIAA